MRTGVLTRRDRVGYVFGVLNPAQRFEGFQGNDRSDRLTSARENNFLVPVGDPIHNFAAVGAQLAGRDRWIL